MTGPIIPFARPVGRPIRLLAIGAHPDDIEIGAGGTVLRLVDELPAVEARWVILSGTQDRATEARVAAAAFLGISEGDADVRVGGLRDAWFPAMFADAKATLLESIAGFEPDLVLSPALHDRHQDHRLVAELVWQALRNHQIWEYEIPKYEGDLREPNLYVRLSASVARRKVELIDRIFATQRERSWFAPDVFLGLMRIRGVEARAPEGYAEGFHALKTIL